MTEDTDTSKKQTLRSIYYDEDGFQSISNLYKEAHSINKHITLNYVKDWLAKQSIVQTKRKDTAFNSYVADHPLQQVGIDLADYSKSKDHNDGYAFIFVSVDYFSKWITAIPLKTKQGKDLVEALKQLLNEVGHFDTLVSDQEGGTNTPEFIKILNENKIRHIITSKPNGMVERAIKTIKDLIHTRIVGLKLEHERWIDLLPKVVKLYNEKRIHSTIGTTPRQARDPSNRLQVYLNIRKKAHFNKSYPVLRENDLVRTAIKKGALSKGHHPNFSSQVYKILRVNVHEDGTRSYLLNHPNKKMYYQWELRRVDDVQDKDTT